MESAAEFGRLAMFPLQSVFLPSEDLPLQIFEPRYAEMVRDCLRDNNPRFGTVLISQGREVGGGDVRCDVGTVVRIAECVDIGGTGDVYKRQPLLSAPLQKYRPTSSRYASQSRQ